MKVGEQAGSMRKHISECVNWFTVCSDFNTAPEVGVTLCMWNYDVLFVFMWIFPPTVVSFAFSCSDEAEATEHLL